MAHSLPVATVIRRKPLQAEARRKSDELWQEALDSLPQELQRVLTLHPPPQTDRRLLLDTVVREARQQRQICLQKRWKITRRDGSVIIVRDVFEKIVRWVEEFKGIGNEALRFAPSYAMIPWGIVCMLVKVSINDNEMFAAMINGVEKVTNIIARYAIFEDVYFRQQTSASDQLISSTIALYASILTFLAQAHAYFQENTAKRVLKAAFGQSLTELEESLQVIEEMQVEVDRTAQLVGTEVLQRNSAGIQDISSNTGRMASQLEALSATLVGLSPQLSVRHPETMREAIASIMGPTQRMLESLRRYDDFLEKEQRRDIFDWLSSVKYRIHHQTETQDRLPRSGEWMFQSAEFRNWQSSSISGTLWLHGMPGSGKSKLASAVIDGALEGQERSATELAPVAYFYCSRNRSEPERADPAEILRCIARQLCGDDLDRPVSEMLLQRFSAMDKPRTGEAKLPLDQTVGLILNVLADNPGTIIIDALDECDPRSRYQLFESLDTIVQKSPNVVKVFLTSRNDGDIVCRLNNTPNIYINAQKNKSDIERFIETEVRNAVMQKRMLNGKVSEKLQAKIVAALNQGAQGMFRWVSLQVQNLCDPRRMKMEEDILYELQHLPKALSDLYSISFDQIFQLGHSSYRLALASLQLLVVAVRPIPWREFLSLLSRSKSVLGRTTTKAEILDITANLMEDDKIGDLPRFVHLSAREYLETRPEFLPEVANMAAATICLENIAHPAYLATERYTYSTLYIGNHLSSTTAVSRRGAVDVITSFLVSEPGNDASNSGPPALFNTWRQKIQKFHDTQVFVAGPDQGDACQVTLVSSNPLLAICAMGLDEVLPALRHISIESKVDVFFPSLSWKAQEAVSRYRNRNCLELAVMFQRVGVLHQLQIMGFGNAFSTYANYEGDSLLHLAAKLGYAEVLEALLQLGMNPNKQNWAAQTKQPSHSENILEGWSTDPIPIRPQTSMGYRTYYGGKSGVFSPFHANSEAKYPIHLAAERESGVACVEVLIRYGADVNIRTSDQTTTLQLALESRRSKHQMFSILLKAGARPNDTLDKGQTILHLVAAMGLSNIVELLLAHGADKTVVDDFGHTPADMALRYGHAETAKMLGHYGPGSCHLQLPSGTGDDAGRLRPPNPMRERRVRSTGDLPIAIVIHEPEATPLGGNPSTSNQGKSRRGISPKASFSALVKQEWSRMKSNFR